MKMRQSNELYQKPSLEQLTIIDTICGETLNTYSDLVKMRLKKHVEKCDNDACKKDIMDYLAK